MFIPKFWGVPQWAIIVLTIINLVWTGIWNGKNITRDIRGACLSAAIEIVFLAAGGFFASFKLPQCLEIIFIAFAIGDAIRKDGEKQIIRFPIELIGTILSLMLYTWGGFFA